MRASASAVAASWTPLTSTSRWPPNSEGARTSASCPTGSPAAASSCSSASGWRSNTAARTAETARARSSSSSPTTTRSREVGAGGAAATPAWCHAPATFPGGDAPAPGVADDGDVAVPVGALDAHAVLAEQPQRVRGGMAVVVVGTDRDQRHSGAGGGEEVGVDVGAAVVRHLEDVGAQVDPAVEDPLLRLGAEVSGEQHPDPVHRHAGDDGQVVGRGARGGDLPRRGEHLQGRVPDPAGPPGDDGLPAGACGGPAAGPPPPPGVRPGATGRGGPPRPPPRPGPPGAPRAGGGRGGGG